MQLQETQNFNRQKSPEVADDKEEHLFKLMDQSVQEVRIGSQALNFQHP